MQKKDKNKVNNRNLKTLAIFSLAIFLILLVLVKLGLTQIFDNAINSSIPQLYNSYLGAIILASFNATSVTNILFFEVLIFLGLIIAKRHIYAITFALCTGSAFFIEFITKIIIQRVRPENAIATISEFSFPSGHATMAGVMASFFIYSFKDDIKNKSLRVFFIIFCTFLALLVGLGRIYTNVHWTTDVLAGYALGVFSFAIFTYYINPERK